MLQFLIIPFKPPPFSQSKPSLIDTLLTELVCHQILPDKQRVQLFLLSFLFLESNFGIGFIHFLASGHKFIKLANIQLKKMQNLFNKHILKKIVGKPVF